MEKLEREREEIAGEAKRHGEGGGGRSELGRGQGGDVFCHVRFAVIPTWQTSENQGKIATCQSPKNLRNNWLMSSTCDRCMLGDVRRQKQLSNIPKKMLYLNLTLLRLIMYIKNQMFTAVKSMTNSPNLIQRKNRIKLKLFQSICLLPSIFYMISSCKCGLVTLRCVRIYVCVEDPLPNPCGPYRDLALSFFQIPSAPFLWALLTVLQLHMTHLITSHSVVLGPSLMDLCLLLRSNLTCWRLLYLSWKDGGFLSQLSGKVTAWIEVLTIPISDNQMRKYCI